MPEQPERPVQDEASGELIIDFTEDSTEPEPAPATPEGAPALEPAPDLDAALAGEPAPESDEEPLASLAETEGDALVIEFGDDEPPAEHTPAAKVTPTPPSDALVVEIGDEEEFLAKPMTAKSDLELSWGDLAIEPTPTFTGMPAYSTPGKVGEGKVGTKAEERAASFKGVLWLALAGFIGGLLAWGLSEPLQSVLKQAGSTSHMVMNTAVYAGVVGIAIGGILGLAYGISTGASSKMVSGAFVGALSGLIGGLIGGSIAQYIYGSVSMKYLLAPVGQVLLRSMGWSLMGLFFGIGQAALVPANKKMRNGIIGGVLGGLLGGAAFQLLLFVSSGTGFAMGGRCLALCVMGTAIGLMIGLVEEVAKEAWVRIIAGPLNGKQFILYEERTTIGAGTSSSIMLFKDPQVAPDHAVIMNERTDFTLSHLAPGAVTLVQGRPVTRQRLEDGDVISIGNTQMAFHERAKQDDGQGAKSKKK